MWNPCNNPSDKHGFTCTRPNISILGNSRGKRENVYLCGENSLPLHTIHTNTLTTGKLDQECVAEYTNIRHKNMHKCTMRLCGYVYNIALWVRDIFHISLYSSLDSEILLYSYIEGILHQAF